MRTITLTIKATMSDTGAAALLAMLKALATEDADWDTASVPIQFLMETSTTPIDMIADCQHAAREEVC